MTTAQLITAVIAQLADDRLRFKALIEVLTPHYPGNLREAFGDALRRVRQKSETVTRQQIAREMDKARRAQDHEENSPETL